MNPLIYILFVTSLTTSIFCHDDYKTKEIPELVEYIKLNLGDKWDIDGHRHRLIFKHKNSYKGWDSQYQKDAKQPPSEMQFHFSLKIVKKIEPENYEKHKKYVMDGLNKFESELKKTVKFKENKIIRYEKVIDYYPATKDDWTLLMKFEYYNDLKYDLPDYYYKNLGLKLFKFPDNTTFSDNDTKIKNEAIKDMNKVLNLLVKYTN